MSESSIGKLEAASTSPPALPPGFRRMTFDEGRELPGVRHLLLFDRGLERVVRYELVSVTHPRGWQAALRDRGECVESVWLIQDDARQVGPLSRDASFVAVMPIDLTDPAPLERAGLYPIIAKEALEDARHVLALERATSPELLAQMDRRYGAGAWVTL